MNTDTVQVYRKTDVPQQVAIDALYAKFPREEGWELQGGTLKTATKQVDGVDTEVYVATLVKKAEPFPPGDDAAADDAPPVEDEEPKEEKPEHKSEGGNKEVLHLLKEIATALGVGADKDKGPEAREDPMGPGPEAEGALPPPVKPHHDMGRSLGPSNLPAFGSAEIQRVAKARTSILEIEYDPKVKLATYVAHVNAQLAPAGRKVKTIQTGVVNGTKLVRIAVGPGDSNAAILQARSLLQQTGGNVQHAIQTLVANGIDQQTAQYAVQMAQQ